MNPRNYRWILGVALLALIFMGVSPVRGAVSVLPTDQRGTSPTPGKIFDPPTKGGGSPTDGGDPDEVVIFIVTPGQPVVGTSSAKSPQTVPSSLSSALTEIQALLFWAGVVR
jgi:hypothetical protein